MSKECPSEPVGNCELSFRSDGLLVVILGVEIFSRYLQEQQWPMHRRPEVGGKLPAPLTKPYALSGDGNPNCPVAPEAWTVSIAISTE